MTKRTSPRGKQKVAVAEEPIIQIQNPQEEEKKKRLMLIIAGAAALAVSLAIYILRLDKVVGLIVDDAWYVLLAKALATGQGYTLINSPTPGITPFYAPGFPALLSIFYRLSPNFPENVWLLKSVSIAAMIGAGFIAFRYFNRQRALPVYVAFAIAFATTIYPALVFLATSSVMSECVFTLTQLAAIFLIEKSVARDSSGGKIASAWSYAAIGGALASFAFLTRPAGLGLLIGTPVYLFKERLPKQALIFAAVVALLVGPWTIYSRSHAPTPEQSAEQGANIVQPYATQFWQREAGKPLSGTITLGDLPERVWNNLSEIGRFDFGAFVFYSLYRPLEPGELAPVPNEARMISLFFALLALAGFIATARERMTLAEIVTPLAIGVSLFWGWEQYRLLLPLIPFIFFYLLMGVRLIARLYRKLYAGPNPRGELVPLLIVSWLFVISGLYSNYQYIQRKYDPVPENRSRWISAFRENEAFIRYTGETVPKEDVIATQNPALVNLYTGRKTVASDDPASRWETWNRVGVRYLARTSPFQLPKPDANESKYRTIHRSAGALGLRLIDLGPPSSRPAW
ncbi:MAG: hypothetical protein ACREAM_22350, partial [Blastocatellia bacterium]